MFAYPMGMIYRTDLLNDEAFRSEYEAATDKELALPDSVSTPVEES